MEDLEVWEQRLNKIFQLEARGDNRDHGRLYVPVLRHVLRRFEVRLSQIFRERSATQEHPPPLGCGFSYIKAREAMSCLGRCFGSSALDW